MAHSGKCANCDAELHGEFCSRCGQPESDGHPPTIGHFAHDLMHEVLHIDGKIGRSARALVFAPGLLTQEYWAGRVANWIRPVRLFLIAAALHLFLAPGTGPVNLRFYGYRRIDSGVISLAADTRVRTTPPPNMELLPEESRRELQEKFDHAYLAVRYISPLLFALFSFWVYRRRQPYFVHHLVFALHFYATWYVIAVISGWLGRWSEYSALLGFAAIPYLFVTMRRVYGLTAVRAVMGTGILFAALMLIEGLIALGAMTAAMKAASHLHP